MKKKLFSILVCGVLLLGLTGCGKETLSKEKMIEKASNLSLIKLNADMKENSVNATDEYIGKIFKYTGAVYSITEDYVILNNKTITTQDIRVYLSKEEKKQLKKGQVIVVVGELQNENGYELKNAYFVSDSIDINLGLVETFLDNTGSKPKWSDDCRIQSIEKNSADFYYYLKDYKDITTNNEQKIVALGGVKIKGAKAVEEYGKIVIKSYNEIEAISKEDLKQLASQLENEE